jgi:hypothetical protein
MKKLLSIMVLGLILSSNAYAKKNKKTWDYPFSYYGKYRVEGSKDFYNFKSDLRKNENVSKEIQNNKKTGLISYLLFENDKIVVDESDIPKKVDKGDIIVDGLLPSHSIGKSLVSYVAGHAICEGYISSIDEKITGWNVVNNTLYENLPLIDLLNMQAGDQKYVGEKLKPKRDNILKKNKKINVNTIRLNTLMKEYFQGTKKSKQVYNYSALTTNLIMNYTIHKTGKDWKKLLHKVFNEHAKVKNNVYFSTTVKWTSEGSGRYSFYATRDDYLRIAKTILEDWHSDTCIGNYLRTIYERRIEKKDKVKEADDVGLYTKSYGGQFHFDIYGIDESRKIIGMSGFAGQQIVIDLDNKRIIVISALFKNYDWKNIVFEVIKKDT